jgi:hypothetical protein
MSSRPTTIELNGKRYDARTGSPLSAHEAVSAGQQSHVKPSIKKQGVALDGFTRRKPSTAHVSPAHSVHKKTQKSQTLMRSVVKKPATAPGKPLKARHMALAPVKQHDVDPTRASRAKSVKKSNLVSRFGAPQKAIKPIPSDLPVQPEPVAPPIPVLEHHKSQVSAGHGKHNLEHALHKAESHKQPRPHKTTRRDKLSRKLHVSTRTINVAAASMAFVLLGGFIAYQNVPNFSMKVATTRAGVEGRLPGYQPNGFSMSGPIKYQPGQITVNYSSNSDQRSFSINQRTSQWNSDTLLENYVATGQKNYQTFQDSGKTIYIYDSNNATWVDGGVWYQIEGNSSLNSDQLLRMAASM